MVARASITGSRIRTFEADDVPQVADLHRRVFRTGVTSAADLAAHRAYFADVFLAQGRPTRLRSLVCCEGSAITGFLGVVGRPMIWKGERIEAAVSSQFVVEPRNRGAAGVQLVRAFLGGPQDLSIADESNANSRRLWEALGGLTSLAHSVQWFCPLAPCRLALWAVAKSAGAGRLLPRMLTPVARGFDAIASRARLNPFRATLPPGISGEILDADALHSWTAEFAAAKSLYAIGDARRLASLMARPLRELGASAPCRAMLVRSSDNERVAGSYVYYVDRQGVAEAMQVLAAPGRAIDVLRHLAHDAASLGAIAVRGRSEPALAGAIGELHWPCHWGPWVLLHSRRPELTAAFQGGDVMLSRLDGEWGLRFG